MTQSGQPARERLGSTAWVLVMLGLWALPGRVGAAIWTRHAWEVVTLEARRLPAALGAGTDRLSLVRARNGVLAPVPFQVDERDPEGRFALPSGPEPTIDDSPGTLDANDLLVFPASALGERFHLPRATEIEARDPASGERGYVYVRLLPRGAVRPPVPDTVRYDPERDTVFARRYIQTFGPHTPIYLAFIGPDGTPGPNVLDRVKARIAVKLLGGLLTFHRTEQDIVQSVMAWKDGPVRVIRRARIEARIGYGLPKPKVIAETIFTGDTFRSPATVHIPFDLRYVVGDLVLRTYMDFADLRGFRIFTAGHPPALLECGVPVPPVNGVRTDWFGMAGPGLTFVQALLMSSPLDSVVRRLYAVADPTPDPPERLPGNCPGVGYTLTHWSGIGRGEYWSDTVVRAFDTYDPAVVEDFLYGLKHPLELTVHSPRPAGGGAFETRSG